MKLKLNGFRPVRLYLFNVNAVDNSKCKGHIINNVSTCTTCNDDPDAALPILSIEDFNQVIGENAIKKVRNTQQPPSEKLEALRHFV